MFLSSSGVIKDADLRIETARDSLGELWETKPFHKTDHGKPWTFLRADAADIDERLI